MQTTLFQKLGKDLCDYFATHDKEFMHFLGYFLEWRELKQNPNGNGELKRFESLHGKAFVESLNFFEKLLEEPE